MKADDLTGFGNLCRSEGGGIEDSKGEDSKGKEGRGWKEK